VYASYTMERTQIYLEKSQLSRLRSAARSTHRTVSDVVREAIDEKLAQPSPSVPFEEMLKRATGVWAERKDLGSTEDYVRARRLDRRGRAGK